MTEEVDISTSSKPQDSVMRKALGLESEQYDDIRSEVEKYASDKDYRREVDKFFLSKRSNKSSYNPEFRERVGNISEEVYNEVEEELDQISSVSGDYFDPVSSPLKGFVVGTFVGAAVFMGSYEIFGVENLSTADKIMSYLTVGVTGVTGAGCSTVIYGIIDDYLERKEEFLENKLEGLEELEEKYLES